LARGVIITAYGVLKATIIAFAILYVLLGYLIVSSSNFKVSVMYKDNNTIVSVTTPSMRREIYGVVIYTDNSKVIQYGADILGRCNFSSLVINSTLPKTVCYGVNSNGDTFTITIRGVYSITKVRVVYLSGSKIEKKDIYPSREGL
jgi:hypothetical protein